MDLELSARVEKLEAAMLKQGQLIDLMHMLLTNKALSGGSRAERAEPAERAERADVEPAEPAEPAEPVEPVERVEPAVPGLPAGGLGFSARWFT